MQQHIGRSGRSHAEKRTDDARRGHRRLEHVGLEPLIEKIDRTHGHQLDLVVLVLRRQLPEARQQAEQLLQPARGERRRVSRFHGEDRLDESSHGDHRAAVLVARLGVDAGMPCDLPARPGMVVHAPQVVAVRHRGERAVERKNLEAVPRQIELADDLGPQQRHDGRADGEPEAGKYLSDRGAAEHVAPFEDQHLASGARQ